ncbi:hypothetical protein PQX77_016762 [Marasmius sp. AFHP31]|nr:hypothetical protein PQX77_016762 [Marasmius sp. AFHP31]
MYGRDLNALEARAGWSSAIEPWVIFLIQQVLLASEEPTTPEGMATFEEAMTHIPKIIATCQSSQLQPLVRPFQKLLAQGWLEAVDKQRPSWRVWSIAVGTFVSLPRRTTPTLIPTTSYQQDERFVFYLIRHLDAQVVHVPQMDGPELDHVLKHKTLLHAPTCFPDGSPISSGEHIKWFIAVLLGVMRALAPSEQDYNSDGLG